MAILDTKTNKPWPAGMANLKLQAVREVCRAELGGRNEARGIVGGKVTTTIKDPNMEGKTKEVVDPVKQRMAYTGEELNRLLAARWAEVCSQPQDLEAFIATARLPEKEAVQAAKDAASDIEESLKDPQATALRPLVGASEETPAPAPKRGPGRPKKPVEPVEA